MHKPIPSMDGVTTARLHFRLSALEDAGWWMEYITSPVAVRFMALEVGSAVSCREFIQRSLERRSTDGSGLNAVIERATNRPIGMVGLLTQVVDGVEELEIGYHVVPSAWGQGYASEAAIACKEFARRHRITPSVISL
ncbi:MAG: GNAT family N-acetyltransferase, partial [Flavobacteriales bacterium]